MKLYAVKYKEGYLKDSPQGPAGVTLDKASVYKEKNSKELEGLMKKSVEEGFKEVHLVELTITIKPAQ